jgi:geranylgeranyl pyrophosphate synthase
MILGRVLATDALAASIAAAERHAEAAVDHLGALPPSPARDALIDLAHGSARRRR